MSRVSKKRSNASIKYSSKINNLTSKNISYKPLNLKLSEFRYHPPYSYDDVNMNLFNFLNNNPSKDNLNKLYDTTIYFAEFDSPGADRYFVREFTRELFDILCKIMKIKNLNPIITNLIKEKYQAEEKLLNDKILYFTKKYAKRKNISDLVKRYRKTLEKEKKHFPYNNEIIQYLIDNNILNNKEQELYKKSYSKEYINGWAILEEYIKISFNLLHHLRIL